MDAWYSDGELTLIHDDAFHALQCMPASSVDCTVTSPPYWGLRDYGNSRQIGLEPSADEYLERLESVFAELLRVTLDSGTLWLNIADRHKNGRLLNLPYRLAERLESHGWIPVNDVIWRKTNPMPQSVRRRLSTTYEHILVFAKSRRYLFDLNAIRVPAVTPPDAAAMSFDRKTHEQLLPGQHAVQHRRRTDNSADGLKNPGDVWDMAVANSTNIHFATFPLELARRCVTAGAPEDGHVLDPFNGSGTTGLAAFEHGCRYTGIDLNEDYLELSKRRLAQRSLFGIEATA